MLEGNGIAKGKRSMGVEITTTTSAKWVSESEGDEASNTEHIEVSLTKAP